MKMTMSKRYEIDNSVMMHFRHYFERIEMRLTRTENDNIGQQIEMELDMSVKQSK